MATWAMLKTEKMRNQAKQRALGSYGRFTENATKAVARQGGQRFVGEPRASVAIPASNDVVVQRLAAGKAAGLGEDMGRMGKGKRVAFRATGGNGDRRRMGLTAESYVYVTELVSNAH